MTDKDTYLKTLGQNVRRLRKELHLTQAELANKCGYDSENSRSTISKIEKGVNDVSASQLKQLATALGVSACDLIGNSTHLHDKSKSEKLIEQSYGKDALNVIQLFSKLDQSDQQMIFNIIQQFSSQDKYSVKKESRNA